MNDLASLVPQSIAVVFQAADGTTPRTVPYAVTISLSSLALSQYGTITGAPWTLTLHRYEVATFAGAIAPTNATTLTSLATQFASDWYLWQLARYDKQFKGFLTGNLPGALHDIEWFQRPAPMTRLMRRVFNPREDLIPTGQFVVLSNENQREICDPGQAFSLVNNVCAFPYGSRSAAISDTTLSGSEQTLSTLSVIAFQPMVMLFTGVIDWNNSSANAAAGDTYEGRLYNGNTQITGVMPYITTGTNTRLTTSQTWVASLTQGSYTFTLRALRTAGSSNFLHAGVNTYLSALSSTDIIVQKAIYTLPNCAAKSTDVCTTNPLDCCPSLISGSGGASGSPSLGIICPITCNACGMPYQLTVTLAGLVNGVCSSCTTFNTTRTLNLQNLSECRWRADFLNICNATNQPDYMEVFFNGTTNEWEFTTFVGTSKFVGIIDGKNWNCTGTNVFAVANQGDECGGTNVTATVTIPACNSDIVQTPCCGTSPVKICLQVTGGGETGNYNAIYDGINQRWQITDPIGSCTGSTVTFQCDASGNTLFTLIVNGVTYHSAVSATCNPIGATFSNVDFTGCGGTTGGTVVIVPGACPSGGGTVNTSVCCPSNPIPQTLCLTTTGALSALNGTKLTWISASGTGAGAAWGFKVALGTGITVCGQANSSLAITCQGDGTFAFDASIAVSGVSGTPTCNPFSVSFSGNIGSPPGGWTCGTGAWTAKVSSDLTGCGGGGGGNTIATQCCPSNLLPATLTAVFTGALSAIGTVKLTWDVNSQAYLAITSACINANIVFKCTAVGSPVWQLRIEQGNAFQSFQYFTKAQQTCNPFLWTGTFTANQLSPPCNGVFGVTITP